MTVIETHRTYRFGSADGLSHRQKEALAACLSEPPQEAVSGILPGRAGIQTVALEGIGRVVIKPYFRGGMLRHFNRRTYIRIGRTRAQAEYESLRRIRAMGVNAPEPVAYISCGHLFYHAWLATKALEAVKSLAEISKTAPERVPPLIPELVCQLRRLIDEQIHHVDMHPGNVLVTPADAIYLIDFDKARRTRLPREKLTRRYCRRWRQAVAKYGLPASLDAPFEERLLEGEGDG